MASASVTPVKSSWHDIFFGGYMSASVEVDELFQGVSRIDFSVVTTAPSLATIVKLFTLSTHIPRNYCLTPVTQPDGSGDWDVQHLSNVEMVVWKVSADLSESGGGILLEVAGSLSGAALPSEFSVGMQVRLDNIPTKFLVGVKNMAVAAAAAKVIAAAGPADVHNTISPGKHNIDTTNRTQINPNPGNGDGYTNSLNVFKRLWGLMIFAPSCSAKFFGNFGATVSSFV